MKKLLAIFTIATALYATNAEAQQQGGNDTAAMMTRMKERIKPQLMEKTKLTDEQADKVIQINFNERQQMRGLRDLSEEDRKKKMDEMQADVDKKYKDIPLTDEQITSVNSFFDEMRKNRQQRNGGNGNGGQ